MSKDKPIIPDDEEEVLNESAATSSDYIPSETEEPAGEGETISLAGMFRDYWIDYASDVILDRSVPDIDDGLKPVQRRILHSMEEMDDGRMNKVQSIVGHTMMYHPHGDQSIKDALVNIGQKNLLVDCQGNWGNILTGEEQAVISRHASRNSPKRWSSTRKPPIGSPATTDVTKSPRRCQSNFRSCWRKAPKELQSP